MARAARMLLVGIDGANPRETDFNDPTNVCQLVRAPSGKVLKVTPVVDRRRAPTHFDRAPADEEPTENFTIAWEEIEAELIEASALLAEPDPPEVPTYDGPMVIVDDPPPRVLTMIAALATCFLLSYDVMAAEPLMKAIARAEAVAVKIRGL